MDFDWDVDGSADGVEVGVLFTCHRVSHHGGGGPVERSVAMPGRISGEPTAHRLTRLDVRIVWSFTRSLVNPLCPFVRASPHAPLSSVPGASPPGLEDPFDKNMGSAMRRSRKRRSRAWRRPRALRRRRHRLPPARPPRSSPTASSSWRRATIGARTRRPRRRSTATSGRGTSRR